MKLLFDMQTFAKIKPSRKLLNLQYVLTLCMLAEGSDEIEHMRRLISAFAARLYIGSVKQVF